MTVTTFREAAIVVDGVRVSEAWNLHKGADGNAIPNPERRKAEWIERNSAYAKATGFAAAGRVTVDPKDDWHVLHEAWRAKPHDEGQPRWFGAD